MLFFVGGGKLENPEKNPQSNLRTNNKPTQIEAGPHWWKASALTIVSSLLPNVRIKIMLFEDSYCIF